MPRWIFLVCVAALVLAVLGSALVALKGRPAAPRGPATSRLDAAPARTVPAREA